MSGTLTQIMPTDRRENAQVNALLEQEGIRRDGNLDYTCGIFDDGWQLIATGSCFRNTIRCLAVSSAHRGEGLLNQIIGRLMEVQLLRGNTHLFLYTKPETVKFMSDLGFYEIARVGGKLVFMENRRNGFSRFLAGLEQPAVAGQRVAGIVMNANPFTKGHLHLVTRAAEGNDTVHLFLLSEEAGPIPFAVRKRLVQAGTAHLDNVIIHESGPYLISSATFPSYFLKDTDTVIRTQAELDLKIFGKIAEKLGIQRRYAGQEPSSHVTALYNRVMAEKLPQQGVEFVEIPRLTVGGAVISASTVRQAIKEKRLETVWALLPPESYAFFAGPEGEAVCAAIGREENVIHY